jgi:hypothetical protein
MAANGLIRAQGSRPRRISGAPAPAGLALTPSPDQAGGERSVNWGIRIIRYSQGNPA